MDYFEYADWRKHIVPGFTGVDLGNLDLYGTVPVSVPERTFGHKGMNVHRCHLVEDFLRVHDLGFVNKKDVAVSEGVRHSLRELMKLWGEKKWVLSADQYPYYKYQAVAHDLNFVEIAVDPTMPLTLPEGDVLVLCVPLKPFGVAGKHVVEPVKAWLAEKPGRHVLIDYVYAFDIPGTAWVWELFETGQATVLTSLSKLFSAPNVAGFTFSKHTDVRQHFVSLPKDEQKMSDAFVLLNQTPEQSRLLKAKLMGADIRLRSWLESQTVYKGFAPILSEPDFKNPHYLWFTDQYSFDELLEQGIITVPGSVYGVQRPGVIISSLGFVNLQ